MQMQRHKCASYPKFVGCSFLMPTATNPGLIHLVVSLALHDSTIRQAEAEASSRPFGTRPWLGWAGGFEMGFDLLFGSGE